MLIKVLLALILLTLVVILYRTVQFKPKEEKSYSHEDVSFDKEAAVSALQQLIRCKTVSYHDHSKEDDAEFEKLYALLPDLYPNVLAPRPRTAVLLYRQKA